MKKRIRYVGLDVHKETIVIAVADEGRGPARVLETVPNDTFAVVACLERIAPRPCLSVCYEAGPTGFGLARYLNDIGICCVVVAPSLIPQRAGERIKTDRRDAVKLAHFLRSGDLVEIHIPEAQNEAMRDLERARGDAKKAELAARHQLDKFLLRHGRRWEGGATKWTVQHLAWVRRQQFPEEASRRVHADYLAALEQATQRVARLSQDLEELVECWCLGPMTKAFQALRGFQTVSAATLAAEIGDYTRFAHPRQLMAYVGLVPSERSSGGSRRQGSITRTGNRHVRRILIEAAWHYRHRPHVSKALAARQRDLTEPVRQIAWKAQERLHRRYARLLERGKLRNKVVTAVARELVGFVWAIARQPEYLKGKGQATSA